MDAPDRSRPVAEIAPPHIPQGRICTPAAKEFLKWLHGKDQFGKWFEIESGYSLGATTFLENHPMWERTDEALRAFRNSPRGTRMLGHAGPPKSGRILRLRAAQHK